uniref:Uncharacterized protein n=2 Tax=Physcomitrium patens TaxID=3218 RepID=A0A7I4ED32_PHYPA
MSDADCLILCYTRRGHSSWHKQRVITVCFTLRSPCFGCRILFALENMASRHTRHSSVDTLGWIYTNRVDTPPDETVQLDHSVSTRLSNFARDMLPPIKRQTSIRFNPGEYFGGCFGPHKTKGSDHGSQQPILMDSDTMDPVHTTTRRPPRSRSRSLSTSFLGNFNFAAMKFGEKNEEDSSWELEMRVAELNHKAATEVDRVQSGGRWVIDEDDDYVKPPAWKQAIRRLRAEAKRHVHPATPRDRLTNYDVENYEKNFDDNEKGSLYMVVAANDEFGVKARVLHTNLLARLHSHRFEDSLSQNPPAKLLKCTSMPVAPVNLVSKSSREDGVSIWQRRQAARPLVKLELTRSM